MTLLGQPSSAHSWLLTLPTVLNRHVGTSFLLRGGRDRPDSTGDLGARGIDGKVAGTVPLATWPEGAGRTTRRTRPQDSAGVTVVTGIAAPIYSYEDIRRVRL